MKNINVIITGRIVISEPEYYNNHSGRITATLQSPDGTTNYRHVHVICAVDEDPTEKVLAAFGAQIHQVDSPEPERASDRIPEKRALLQGLVAKAAPAAPAPKPKKVAIKKSVAKK